MKVRGGAGNYCLNRPRVTDRSRACGGVYARLGESGVCGFRMLEAPALHPCNAVDCTAHQGIEERAKDRLARGVDGPSIYWPQVCQGPGRLWPETQPTFLVSWKNVHLESPSHGLRSRASHYKHPESMTLPLVQPGIKLWERTHERTPSRSSTSPVLRCRGGKAPASLGNVCTLHWVVRSEDRGILGNSGLSIVNSTPGKALRQCVSHMTKVNLL